MSTATAAPAAPIRFFTLPNLITLTSLNLGALAVVAALVDGGPAGLRRGAALVLLGVVCDVLDGRVARATGQQSALGAQLDSFADFVTFGLAPAALFHAWGLARHGTPGLVACAVYATATALRLARFNVHSASGPQPFFEGLPSTGAALTVATALLVDLQGGGAAPHAPLALAAALGVAMVSRARFPTFKLGLPRSLVASVLALFALVAFVAGPLSGVLAIVGAYFVLGAAATWPLVAARRAPRTEG